VNYITANGAARLRTELEELRASGGDPERIAELESILGSVTIVDAPDASSNSVSFGATVTVRDAEGKKETYAVVGVDELGITPNAVSWISPVGKALLAANLGDRVTIDKSRTVKIEKIE
jgi:transcription elongation GreA/GreB family factor